MKKTELRERILDLRWHALPYYERWAYPKELCSEKNIHIKQQLQVQRWQVKYIRNVVVGLLILSLITFVYTPIGWQLSLFFLLAASALLGVEYLMKKRLQMLRRAVKLRKKLKKKH